MEITDVLKPKSKQEINFIQSIKVSPYGGSYIDWDMFPKINDIYIETIQLSHGVYRFSNANSHEERRIPNLRKDQVTKEFHNFFVHNNIHAINFNDDRNYASWAKINWDLRCSSKMYSEITQKVFEFFINKEFNFEIPTEPFEAYEFPFEGPDNTLEEAYWLEGKGEGVRFEGGLAYPDALLKSWRWLYGSPYVSMPNQTDNNKFIRVYYEPYHAHLYLRRVTPEIGMENLVSINFPYQRDKRGDLYCHVSQWAESKKGHGGEIIRYKIIGKNDWGLKVAAMLYEEKQFERNAGGYFYELTHIMSIDK